MALVHPRKYDKVVARCMQVMKIFRECVYTTLIFLFCCRRKRVFVFTAVRQFLNFLLLSLLCCKYVRSAYCEPQ